MNCFAWALSLSACLVMTIPVAAEDQPLVVKIWPGVRAPADEAVAIGPERIRHDIRVRGKPYEIAGQPVTWISNVTEPTLTLYRPAPDNDNGAAVIVCPGGGFWNLAIDLEGVEVARWLNTLGVTGIVLKYRVPRRPGRDEKRPSPEALDDAQRAVSVVRSRASEWGLDPHRIGMVGFSVGGNVVAVTATNFDKLRYPKVDAVDEVSNRPDFGICCYSGYLDARDKIELDPTLRATADAPPLFLVHASDDTEAKAEISVNGYLALQRAGADVELHMFQKGEHGFGVRKRSEPVTNWTETCADWMRFKGFLTPSSSVPAAAGQ